MNIKELKKVVEIADNLNVEEVLFVTKVDGNVEYGSINATLKKTGQPNEIILEITRKYDE